MALGSFSAMRELALVAGGKITGLLALFACGVLAARVTGPEQYSLYAAALTLILLLDGMIGAPLDWAMVRFGSLHREEPARVERMLGGTFRLKLLIALSTGLIAFILREPLANALFKTESGSQLIIIIILSTFGLLALRGTAAYLQLNLRFRTYATLDLVSACIRLAVILFLMYAGIKTAVPYIAVYGIGALVTFIVGLIIVSQPYLYSKAPPADDRRSLVRFVGATGAIIILSTISGRADLLFLTAMNSAEKAGQYGAATHLAVMATLLASYAGVIAQPRVIEYAKQGRLWVLLRMNLIGGLLVSAVAVPVTIWLLPWLVPLLLGEAFQPSVIILQILIIGTCIDLFTMPVLQTFGIQLCSRATLACEAIVTVIFLLGAPIAAQSGPVAMAWFVTLVRVLKFCFYAAITLRYINHWDESKTAGTTHEQ
ncbi:MAG: lipopolysaccharide biosynthesis protein [Gammaproteobacteria bacterium]